MAGVLVATLVVVPPAGAESPPTEVSAASSPDPERWLLCRINQERASRGLPPYHVDTGLVRDARRWSAQMEADRWPRHDPSLDGVAENWGVTRDLERLHAGMMSSDGHRASILWASGNLIGVGVVTDENGTMWVTQRFARGTPAASADTCGYRTGGGQGPSGFTDVPPRAFYAAAVGWAARTGVTTGTSPTTFNPGDQVTRGQIATFLWRVAGTPPRSGPLFSDVPSGAFFTEAVRWLRAVGLTNGCGGDRYCPHAPATRAEMVTLLWRFAGSPVVWEGHGFGDVPAGSYYERAVRWAASRGITTGTSETTFSPALLVTRAEMVTFLHRYVGRAGSRDPGAQPIAVAPH